MINYVPNPDNFIGGGRVGGVVESYHDNSYANNMITHTSQT